MSTNDTHSTGEKCCNKAPKILGAVIALLLLAGGGAFIVHNNKEKAGSDQSAEMAAATDDSAVETAAGDEAASDEATSEETAATSETGAENPVVAQVNGKDIKRSDVLDFISDLPDHIRQMPVETLFPMALDQVVANEIINAKASAANIGDDPEVAKLLKQAKSQVIRSVYVERQVTAKVTPKALEEAYDEMVAKMGKVEELHARHILVDSEEKAREIITKLDGGAKFEELAGEYTADPSGKSNGGDLGFFAKSDMVPEFANAAFALEPGKYTKDPVKTQFGWHVIKSEGSRTRPAPTMEQVKPQLEQQLRQKALGSLVEGWEKEAKVKKFDIDGKPVKAEETKQN